MSHKQTKAEIKRIAAASSPQDVLSVPLSPGEEQLKAAHRKLARLLHPDFNPGDPAAADAMARVNVAYETLSDPQRRRNHEAVHNTLRKACAKCDGTGYTWKQKGFAGKVRQSCKACGGTGKAPAV